MVDWIIASAAVATAGATALTAYFVWRQGRFDVPVIGVLLSRGEDSRYPELRVFIPDSQVGRYVIEGLSVHSPRGARLAKGTIKYSDLAEPLLDQVEGPWVKTFRRSLHEYNAEVRLFCHLPENEKTLVLNVTVAVRSDISLRKRLRVHASLGG